MKRVDLVLVALILVVALMNIDFNAISGKVVNECIDSDGGKDPYVAGNLIGFDESVKRDFCKDGNTLYEYYCDGKNSNGVFEEFNCANACVDVEGKGACLKKQKVSLENLKQGKCSTGCYFKGTCYTMGTRTRDGMFCSVDERLEWQLFDDKECFNNFECRSNLCIVNKCVSEEVFDKFLESISG